MGAGNGLVVLAPIAPAPTGNGLAMRTDLFRRAASPEFDVQTVVVPVAGRLPADVPASPHVTIGPNAETKAGAMRLVADPVWRDRLARAGSFPARVASPLSAEAVAAVIHPPVHAIHVMRSYLAPLGLALAERLGVAWATLDLDEDDAALAPAAEAAAYGRLLSTFAPLFDGFSAASAAEAEAIGRRHGLEVVHLPNAVDVPARTARPARPSGSLLFVGNLTYAPNVEAARTLVHDVLPALQSPARVALVGPHDGRVGELAGARVDVTGFVPDLEDVYAAADVVVVPLRTGAGTRLKLLEAFAHRVPVVATPVAAAGLECEAGRHLLVAEDAAGLAAAVERLLAGETVAQRLVDAAYDLVRLRYSTDVVLPAIRDFFARAAGERQPA